MEGDGEERVVRPKSFDLAEFLAALGKHRACIWNCARLRPTTGQLGGELRRER